MPTLTKVISRSFTFRSSSGRGTYQTLLYGDTTTSCECPGWTRRVAADGSRSCRHTRCVDMGLAETEAEAWHDHSATAAPLPLPERRADAKAKPAPGVFAELGQRKFNPA